MKFILIFFFKGGKKCCWVCASSGKGSPSKGPKNLLNPASVWVRILDPRHSFILVLDLALDLTLVLHRIYLLDYVRLRIRKFPLCPTLILFLKALAFLLLVRIADVLIFF